jgi:arginyl-tRNA synthetase
VFFKDVADEAVRRVLAVESEKSGDIPENKRKEIAAQIGLGALAFSILSVDNNKDIVFDMNAALSFDGKTGPNIQNAHVRANSILRKAEGKLPASGLFDYELTRNEIELIEQISRFPVAVEQAANDYRPLVMAQYAYDLANAFHSFYAVPVLQSERRMCGTPVCGWSPPQNRQLPVLSCRHRHLRSCRIRLNIIFTFAFFI